MYNVSTHRAQKRKVKYGLNAVFVPTSKLVCTQSLNAEDVKKMIIALSLKMRYH
jgi:hypothetical protein